MTERERLFDRIQMLANQSQEEEIASSIIHGIGILTAIASLVLLVVFASLQASSLEVIAFSLYGGSAVFYYLCSTFHHSLTHYTAKRVFRIMEQSAVYLFITGTVLPVSLIILKSSWGWSLLAVTAVLSIFGILNLFFNKKNSSDFSFIVNFLLVLFLIIGISISLQEFTPAFKVFFVPGAALYLIAAWFAAMNGMKYNQAVAHTMSLFATVFHFFAFLTLVSFT